MFLLDTNVLSELRRPEKADVRLKAWASKQHASQTFISAISVLEIEHGILLKSRRDETQGAVLRSWFDESLLPHFEGRILAIDKDVALECAKLHVPNPKSDRDAMIAATALVNKLTVVTRNVGDFEGTGVNLVNPWTD